MARIRTIKPEFPQSESMGRVSREARLCFILLWTIADDSGRLRGNSRMLASLLYPYDDDSKTMMPVWLSELESEGCIGCYKVESDSYVEILNWKKHQKIDKPSQSKIPPFDESSRILANPREVSSEDQGSRTEGPKDQGPTKAKKEPKEKKRPMWATAYPDEVVSSVAEIMSFWPQSGKGHRQPTKDGRVEDVPNTSPALLAGRLAELRDQGTDMSICVTIARQFVSGWESGRNWIKAAQYFFGRGEDAPFGPYYRAELTSRAMEQDEHEPAV